MEKPSILGSQNLNGGVADNSRLLAGEESPWSWSHRRPVLQMEHGDMLKLSTNGVLKQYFPKTDASQHGSNDLKGGIHQLSVSQVIRRMMTHDIQHVNFGLIFSKVAIFQAPGASSESQPFAIVRQAIPGSQSTLSGLSAALTTEAKNFLRESQLCLQHQLCGRSDATGRHLKLQGFQYLSVVQLVCQGFKMLQVFSWNA